jgi:hypothetical protein
MDDPSCQDGLLQGAVRGNSDMPIVGAVQRVKERPPPWRGLHSSWLLSKEKDLQFINPLYKIMAVGYPYWRHQILLQFNLS